MFTFTLLLLLLLALLTSLTARLALLLLHLLQARTPNLPMPRQNKHRASPSVVSTYLFEICVTHGLSCRVFLIFVETKSPWSFLVD